jgi:SH3-like domain-containing protein
MLLRARAIAAALMLAVACGPAHAGAPTIGPSGKPVPRYESLKFGEVNGRQGPSFEHRVLWTYHRRGLPVRVVAESDVWRQIADPDGDLSWVHAAGLTARRTVYVAAAAPVALRQSPQMGARTVAILGHGVVASLEACRSGWRRLKIGRRHGWAPMAALWGAEQCDAAPS